jgi:hypothetical protein
MLANHTALPLIVNKPPMNEFSRAEFYHPYTVALSHFLLANPFLVYARTSGAIQLKKIER